MTDDKKFFPRPIGWYRLSTKQRLLWAENVLKQMLKKDDERRRDANEPPGANCGLVERIRSH